MKPSLVVLTAAAILIAAISASARVSAASESSAALADPSLLPPRELVHYGHVRSLTRKGGRFEMRFDPAFWLGGLTANRAAVEDMVIQPGEAVPNDYYIRDETRRLLTYRVPATARATVLTNTPATGIRSTRVPVAELAQLLKGKNPRRRPLYGTRLGFWIQVATDRVLALDQQYQP